MWVFTGLFGVALCLAAVIVFGFALRPGRPRQALALPLLLFVLGGVLCLASFPIW